MTQLENWRNSRCFDRQRITLCDDFDHEFELILPINTAQIICNLTENECRDYTLDKRPDNKVAGVCVKGPATRPKLIDTRAQKFCCGIKFAPGGFYALFGRPVNQLSDRILGIDDLFGTGTIEVRDALIAAGSNEECLDTLEQFTLSHLVENPKFEKAFSIALEGLLGGAEIKSLEQKTGLSTRNLIHMFRNYVGYPPKTFARLTRFQNLVAAIDRGESWSDRAVAHGYSDQAHMIRDFKRFAGITPSTYQMRSPEARNHIVADNL